MKACGQQRHLVCPHQSMPAPKLGAASQRGGHSTFPWPADMKHWPPAVRAWSGDPQGSSRNRSDPGCGVGPAAEPSGPGLVKWALAGPMGYEVSTSLHPAPSTLGDTFSCSCSTPAPAAPLLLVLVLVLLLLLLLLLVLVLVLALALPLLSPSPRLPPVHLSPISPQAAQPPAPPALPHAGSD